MSKFDIDTYFNKRNVAELQNTYARESGESKYDELKRVSNEKQQDLTNLGRIREENKRALFGDSAGGLMDTLVATVADPVSFAGNAAGKLLDAFDANNAADSVRNFTDLSGLVGTSFDTGEKTSGLQRRIILDGNLALAQGAASALQIPVGLASIFSGGEAGKLAQENGFRAKEGKDILSKFLSPEMRAAEQKVSQANGFVNTLEEGLSNPSVIAKGVVESLPSMLAGGLIGRGIGAATGIGSGLAGSIGEGLSMAGNQAEEIRQENADGRLSLKQALYAAGTGVMGTAVGALGNRVAKALRVGDIDEAVVKGALTASPRGLTSSATLSGAIEGGEELLQSAGETIAKNLALNKPYDEGVGNAAAMGLLTGTPMGVAGGFSSSAANTQKTNFEERIKLAEATLANDTSAYLNPESPQRSTTKAVEVLFGHSNLEATTPEVKAANLQQSKEILKMAEDSLQHVGIVNSVMNADPEERSLIETKVASLKTEIAALAPEQTIELKNKTSLLTAMEEGLAQPTGIKGAIARRTQAAALASKEAEYTATKQAQRKFAETFGAEIPPAEISAVISQAKAPAAPNDTAAVEVAQQAVNRVISLSMASPQDLNLTEVAAMAEDTKNTLTEPQRTYLREFSAARIKQNELETADNVHQTILNGDNKGNLGLNDYQSYIGQAVQNQDKGTALRYLSMLSQFAQSHVQKAALVEQARTLADEQGKTVQVVKEAGPNGNWIINTGKPKNLSEMRAIGGVAVHSNSEGGNKFAARIAPEAVAIRQALVAQTSAYALSFGEQSGLTIPAPVVASIVKPIVTSTVTPSTAIAQTTATPSSVAPAAAITTTGSGIKDTLTKVLQTATRTSNTIGEQSDPVAQDIVKSKGFASLPSVLEKVGVTTVLGSLGAGAGSFVLGTNLGALRLGLASEREGSLFTIDSPNINKATVSGVVDGLRYEVYPKADTTNITEADVATMTAALAAEGLVFSDPGTDNLGRVNGKLVVIDAGSVTRAKTTTQSTATDAASVGAAVAESAAVAEVLKTKTDYINNPPADFTADVVEQDRIWALDQKKSVDAQVTEMELNINSPEFDNAAYDKLTDLQSDLRLFVEGANTKLAEDKAAREADIKNGTNLFGSNPNPVTTGNSNAQATETKQTESKQSSRTQEELDSESDTYFSEDFDENTYYEEQQFLAEQLNEIENGTSNSTEDSASQDGNVTSNSESNRDVQAGVSENATENQRDAGAKDSQSAEGVLSVFTGFVPFKEHKLSLNEVYKSKLNLVAQFLKQTGVKAGSLTNKPLVAVKEFFSKWSDPNSNIYAEDFLDIPVDGAFDSKQRAAVNNLYSHIQEWLPKIINSFTIKEISNQDFLHKDLVRQLYAKDEQGNYIIKNARPVLDENVLTAISVGMYNWIVDEAGSPQTMTQAQINQMLGRSKEAPLTQKGREYLTSYTSYLSTAELSIGKSIVQALGLSARDSNTPLDILPRLEAALGAHAVGMLEQLGYIETLEVADDVMSSFQGELVGSKNEAGIFVEEPVELYTKEKNKLYFRAPNSTKNRVFSTKTFMKLARKGGKATDIEEIKVANKGSGGVVSKLFDMQSGTVDPSETPVESLPLLAQGSPQQVSQAQRDAVLRTQSIPHKPIAGMFKLAELLGDTVMKRIAGFVDIDETKHHKDNILSYQAQNDNLENQFDLMMDLVGTNLEKARYVTQSVWRNYRAGFTDAAMNLQSSKFHRYMFSRPSWTNTILLDGSAKSNALMDEFLISFAMAMGDKTDKRLNKDTLATKFRFDEVSGMFLYSDPDVVNAAAAIAQTLSDDPQPISDEDALLIQKVASSEGMVALQALESYAQYMAAAAQTEKDTPVTFEFTMLVGSDGKTNGPMLTLLALGAADFDVLSKGGFYSTEKGQPKHFSQYVTEGKVQDLYETLGGKSLEHNEQTRLWGRDDSVAAQVKNINDLGRMLEIALQNLEAIKQSKRLTGEAKQLAIKSASFEVSSANKEYQQALKEHPFTQTQYAAFKQLTGELGRADAVAKAMRDMIKTPQTAFFFGSALETAVRGMEDDFINAYSTRIEKIAEKASKGELSETQVQDALAEMYGSLNTLLDQSTALNKGGFETFAVQTDLATALKTSLSKGQEEALRLSFKILMGNAVQETISTYFAGFIEKRDALNKTVQASFAIFEMAYNEARNRLTDQLIAEGKLPARTTKLSTVQAKSDLTAKQEAALLKEIKDMLPVMHSAYSKAEDNLDSGIFAGKAEFAKTRNPVYESEVSVYGGTRKPISEQMTYTSPGVAGLSYAIHSSDSFIMHMAMKAAFEALNNHDEISTSNATINEATQEINKQAIEVFLNYSPMASAAGMLGRLLENTYKRAQDGLISPKAVYALLEKMKDLYNVGVSKEDRISVGEAAQATMEKAFLSAWSADATRNDVISRTAYVDQYTRENGQYEVPEATRKQALRQKNDANELLKANTFPASIVEAINFLNGYADNKDTSVYAPQDLSALDPSLDQLDESSTDTTEQAELEVTTEAAMGLSGVLANEAAESIQKDQPAFNEAIEKEKAIVPALDSLPIQARSSAVQALVRAKDALLSGFTPWGQLGKPSIAPEGYLLNLFSDRSTVPVKEVLSAIVDHLATLGPDQKFNHTLARILLAQSRSALNVTMVSKDTQEQELLGKANVSNARGWYYNKTVNGKESDAIYVLSTDYKHSALTTEMLLHEALHGVLARVIANELANAEQNKAYTSPALELVKELQALQAKAQKHVATLSKEEQSKYAAAISDVQELVTWGMTNLDFQENVLKKVSMQSKTRKNALITGIESFIRSLVGLVYKQSEMSKQAQTVNGMNILMRNVFGLIGQAKADNAIQSAKLTSEISLSMAAQINSFSTLDIHEALDTGEVSPAFNVHLKTVLQSIVQKLHGTSGTFKDAIMKDVPTAAVDVMNEALASGVAPFTAELQASGFQFNNQTFFVAEQVEATVKALLDAKDGKMAPIREELRKLEAQVRKVLTPQSFHKGDWATASPEQKAEATKLYDYLFKKVDGDYLARFAALGLSHEGFNEILRNAKLNTGTLTKETGVRVALTRLFDSVLNAANGKITGTASNQAPDVKLAALVRKLVEIENRNKATLISPTKGIFHFADQKMRQARRGTKDNLSTLMNSSMFKRNKNNFISASSHVVDAIAQNHVKYVFKNMMTMRNQASSGVLGPMASVLMEMNGPPHALQKLSREGKAHVEGERQRIVERTNGMVLEAFKDSGTNLTDESKVSMTSVLLRTGMHTLLTPQSDIRTLEKLVSDPAALASAIKAQEAKLVGISSVYRSYMIKHSKALGYHMIYGGGAKTENMMRNAHGIARMRTSKAYFGKISDATSEALTPVIDELVSLYALDYSSNSDKEAVAKVLKIENARTDGGNGARLLLLTHKQAEVDAKERLFKDSDYLMQKGYLPEIYNPHTDLKVGTQEEGSLLENLGYQKVSPLSLDPNDPFRERRNLYILRDGGMRPWLSGIFSFTGMQAKGTKQHGEKAYGTQVVLERLAGDGSVKAGEGEAFDPRKVKTNHMVPLLNSLGKSVNYVYMMENQTKDALLQRENRFDKVTGTLLGSVFDKEKTSDHNRKAVKVLHDDFKAEFTKNSAAFLSVGPNSNNKELREIWNMLPQKTKDDVKAIWGKEEMLVRAENLDIAFGYRKNSLSSVFEKDTEERNSFENAFIWFVERALSSYARVNKGMTPEQADKYALRGAVVIRRGERAWQELVGEAKDIFVVKNVITSFNNMRSNIITLALYGVPPTSGFRDMRIAWVAAEEYQRDSAQLFKLQQQLKAGYITNNADDVQREIVRLEEALKSNAVHEMMEAGLMPTIVEDLTKEDPYAYKTALAKKLERVGKKINPTVRKVGKELYMTHDSTTYQGLSRIVQLSDFVGRYALYKHLTERKVNPIKKPAAIQEAQDAFVSYDTPMHRDLQYMDDMGIFMFTKYFLRIQRVIRGRFVYAPGKVAMLLGVEAYFGNLPTIIDSSILTNFGVPDMHLGPLELVSALPEIAPIKLATGLVIH